MKIINKNFVLLLAVVLIAAQCKKKQTTEETPEEPTPPPAAAQMNSLTEMFAANGTVAQTNVVTAGTAQTLTVSGFRIELPGPFETQSGTPVSGQVNLTFKNVMGKGDFIMSGAPANSAGKLVATKGCVKTSASQNGQVLRVKPGMNVYVSIPDSSGSPNFQLHRYQASKMSVNDSTYSWTAAPDTSYIQVTMDTATSVHYYHVKLDSLNWMNAGYIYNPTGTKTSVTVNNGSSTFNKYNTAIYISFNGMNVVGSLYETSPGVFKIQNIPVGQQVMIVAVGVVNGQYYKHMSSETITSGHTVTLNMQPVALATLKMQLSSLP